jgi:hypothetical protein
MFLRKNKQEDPSQAVRDLVVIYKQAFGTEQGKQVLFDLMDKFHVLNSHKGDAFSEGQRSVVLHIMSRANLNLQSLDAILKGDLE